MNDPRAFPSAAAAAAERPDFSAAYSRLAALCLVRPLSGWATAIPVNPRPHRSPFKAGWGSTVTLLGAELRAVKASAAVLELAIEDKDIRRDGLPRADARPKHQGVILSFYHHIAGPLRYPCDRFDDWQDNVRAIALALEALRAVDRYGVTGRAEQYSGFKRLTAGAPIKAATPEAAAAVLLKHGTGKRTLKQLVDHPELARAAYREATQRTHPDRPNGNREKFESVNDAWKSLAAHHGVEA